MLKRSMVVGVRAGAAERHLEGSVWLLLVTSEAFAVPENLVHATAEYEAGYLVVRGRWFALEQRSPRGYTLSTEEVLVVVNTMIRVPWVLFNGSAAGKAPRESRSGLYILGEVETLDLAIHMAQVSGKLTGSWEVQCECSWQTLPHLAGERLSKGDACERVQPGIDQRLVRPDAQANTIHKLSHDVCQ